MKNEYVRFDWAIKKLLRQKANFPILEGFLSVLLNKKIIIENILESESNKESQRDKQNRVDILAEDDKKQKYIIEVQNSDESSYFHRILFATSKLVTEYINSGEDYDVIPKVYSISLVYFDLGCGEDYIYHGGTEFVGMNKNDVLNLSTYQFDKYKVDKPGQLYPEYYILKINDFNKYAVNSLDEWMEFLKTGIIKEDTKTPGLKEAKEILQLNKMSREEQNQYKQYMCDLASLYNSRNINFDKGKLEGIEEGIEIGVEKSKLEMAQKMLNDNIEIEFISKYTGLSTEQISKLQ